MPKIINIDKNHKNDIDKNHQNDNSHSNGAMAIVIFITIAIISVCLLVLKHIIDPLQDVS